jgi:hypothetical protein
LWPREIVRSVFESLRSAVGGRRGSPSRSKRRERSELPPTTYRASPTKSSEVPAQAGGPGSSDNPAPGPVRGIAAALNERRIPPSPGPVVGITLRWRACWRGGQGETPPHLFRGDRCHRRRCLLGRRASLALRWRFQLSQHVNAQHFGVAFAGLRKLYDCLVPVSSFPLRRACAPGRHGARGGHGATGANIATAARSQWPRRRAAPGLDASAVEIGSV